MMSSDMPDVDPAAKKCQRVFRDLPPASFTSRLTLIF